MKCEKCENELTLLATDGEVVWAEYYTDEEGELKSFSEGVRGCGTETKLWFCKECKTFHLSHVGPIHCDSNEYMQIQEMIGIEEVLRHLSEVMQYSPASINFLELQQACKTIKIDITRVMKNIAYNIVEEQKPRIFDFEICEDEDKDEDVPF